MKSNVDIKEMEEALEYIDKGREMLGRIIDDVELAFEMKDETYNSQLDPNKTFQNYIKSESNKLVRVVCTSFAEYPDTTFNPLYVYGPSGCGKTHLINAIALRHMENFPEKRVAYFQARQFQRDYIESVRQNTTSDFIKYCQSLDLLVVDDVQDWKNAPKTLETFFHIFKDLVRMGKKVILTSDRPPVALKGIKERQLIHIVSGVVAEMEAPNKQFCIDILNAKCRHYGLVISSDVIEFIAREAKGNVCILEGVLNSLRVYSITCDSDIDMNLAERAIKRLVKSKDKI